jgi:hypothetical protein
MSAEKVEICGACGASVYPEHIDSGKARRVDERLLCPHCMEEYRKSHHADEPRIAGAPTIKAPGESAPMDPIAFDNAGSHESTPSQVRAIGGDTLASSAASLHDDVDFRRGLLKDGAGATRCRTFHAKLNDGAVAFMNRQINEWCDSKDDIVIKFATSTIGTWEGKKADPTLIVTVFY